MNTTENENSTTQATKNLQVGATSIQKYIFVMALVLAAVFSLTLVFASKSLPGETLYSLKTNVAERILETTHMSSKNKAWYQVTKMKTRLGETKQLVAQDIITEKALSDITSQISKHTVSLETIVDASIDSAFPKTDILYTLNEFASIAGGIEAVGEHTQQLQPIGDAAEEARQDTERTYKERAKIFVQTETQQTALAYIQEELLRVKNELGNSELSKSTVRTAGDYLDRVEPSLIKNDYYKTILSIGQSYRIISIEKYGGIFVEPKPETKLDTASSTQESTATTSLQSTSSVSQ